MRILVVTNLWPEGGGFRGIFVREQVEALRERGHHVDVEVVAQARGRLDYLTAIPRVRRRARRGGYDLVHVHYGLALVAARFVGLPRVVTLHASDVQVRWQRWFTRLGSGGLADRIYVSSRLASRVPAWRGHVIPGGVDFALFEPSDRALARARFGFGPSDVVVMFGADPAKPPKGYDTFRAVLDRLRADGLPVRELILAEQGQPREQVPLKFAAADLLLFTSRPGTEGSPTVVKEATVMGLPVVTVDVGDVAEVLDGVSPSAVVDFSDQLISSLAARATEVLAARTRSNGRDRNARLDSRRAAERVESVYRSILG